MPKYLVMTLGTGSGVESGLAYSIRVHNPDRVIFLASKTSEKTIERIHPLVPEYKDRLEILYIKNEDDVEMCAIEALECLREL